MRRVRGGQGFGFGRERVREKGAGTNLEYTVDVGCGDHEILTLKCLTNRVNGGVPRSHRRNYGLQSRVRETRVESERRCILTFQGSMIEMQVEE